MPSGRGGENDMKQHNTKMKQVGYGNSVPQEINGTEKQKKSTLRLGGRVGAWAGKGIIGSESE